MLGDGQSAALVDLDGAIDWLCWPRFDSPAIFARLLGGRSENGHWDIRPVADGQWTSARTYLPDTLVLVTTFETPEGSATLTDFLYTSTDCVARILCRLVQCTAGRIAMRSNLCPRFDYGQLRPWIEADRADVIIRSGVHRLRLYVDPAASQRIEDASVHSNFVLSAGERCTFRLAHRLESEPLTPIPDIDVALTQTIDYWQTWIARLNTAANRWTHAVRRSLLTLKALMYRSSGAMVAAPTTSLPEIPGGGANWDYRYSWLRDGSFAMGAFLNVGFREEEWLRWMVDAVGVSPDGVRTLFRVDGERDILEHEVAGLEGYRFSRPVRVGNAAATQRQVDVLGEVIYCISLARRAGLAAGTRERTVERLLVEELLHCWHWRDSGMWESRDSPRHHTYSKVMAWKGLHCALEDGLLESADERPGGRTRGDQDGWRKRVATVCDALHAEVCREAWDSGMRSFT